MVNTDNHLSEKIKLIKIQLTKIDDFSFDFNKEIDNINELHKTNGGYIEYSYVSHFNQEIIGLSNLLQYLLKDQQK